MRRAALCTREVAFFAAVSPEAMAPTQASAAAGTMVAHAVATAVRVAAPAARVSEPPSVSATAAAACEAPRPSAQNQIGGVLRWLQELIGRGKGTGATKQVGMLTTAFS